MPITFPCNTCGQELRAAEQSAGKMARCPTCQELNTIPSRPPLATGTAAEPLLDLRDPTPLPEPARFLSDERNLDIPVPTHSYPHHLNPYSSPFGASLDGLPRPAIKPVIPLPDGEVRPSRVDVGYVLGYAYDIWKENIWLLLAVSFLYHITTSLTSWASTTIVRFVDARLGITAATNAAVICGFVSLFFNIGSWVGGTLVLLDTCRRKTVTFSRIFGGTWVVVTVFLATVIYCIVVVFGLCLFLLPGIMIAILCWPFFYLIVDERATVTNSLSVAFEIGRMNWRETLFMIISSFGILGLGLLFFGIGIIFAIPLISLAWASFFLMMIGELQVAEPA